MIFIIKQKQLSNTFSFVFKGVILSVLHLPLRLSYLHNHLHMYPNMANTGKGYKYSLTLKIFYKPLLVEECVEYDA